MAIFGAKPWVNPFEKMSIFRLLELVLFIAQKVVFSFQNIVKDIFLAYIAKKKKLENRPFLDQNHGLTPLKERQFFYFMNLFFLQCRKAFFRSRISYKTFSQFILPKKKVGKSVIFGPKPQGNPFQKLSIFWLFELLLFIVQKGVFSLQNIVKTFSWRILHKQKKS